MVGIKGLTIIRQPILFCLPLSELSTSGTINYIHYGDIHTKWKTILDCDKEVMSFIDKERLQNIPFLQDGDLAMADASEDYSGLGVSVEVKNVGGGKRLQGFTKNMEPCRIPHLAKIYRKKPKGTVLTGTT